MFFSVLNYVNTGVLCKLVSILKKNQVIKVIQLVSLHDGTLSAMMIIGVKLFHLSTRMFSIPL